MKAVPLNPETESLARRVIWFEEPRVALNSPVRFLAYSFARATHDDMKIVRRYFTDDDLRVALDEAPPGIIDPRSWAFWNSKLGRYPAPAMPKRNLG